MSRPAAHRPGHEGRVVAIIPARLGSTRFPRKVLADETGLPLIEHVRRAALTAGLVERVVIATDDESVAAKIREFRGEAVLTSVAHPNGTSRLAEASRILGLAPRDIVVNVQGDEPEVQGRVIDLLVETLLRADCEVSTICSPMEPDDDPANPNIVKAVLALDGRALYFSRAPIPFHRAGGDASAPVLKHVGLYAYRVEFLHAYAALPATPLERTEMLEQLRVLEHGFRIAAGVTRVLSTGIDTPEQYAAFVRRVKSLG